jgi:hypothetical protein
VFLQSRYKFYYVLARSRYEVDWSREFIPGYKVGYGHCAVSRYNLSRSQKFVKVYRCLIACRCGNPGAETITNLSLVQEQKQKP